MCVDKTRTEREPCAARLGTGYVAPQLETSDLDEAEAEGVHVTYIYLELPVDVIYDLLLVVKEHCA